MKKRLIGLTDLAHQIAIDGAAADGISASEWVEATILGTKLPPDQVESLMKLRRKRGGRGAVVVLPDDSVLPPEG